MHTQDTLFGLLPYSTTIFFEKTRLANPGFGRQGTLLRLVKIQLLDLKELNEELYPAKIPSPFSTLSYTTTPSAKGLSVLN